MAVDINNTTKKQLDEGLVREAANLFQDEFGQKDKDISIAFIGDRVMRRLNFRYRGLDKPTDVLAFPGGGESGAAEDGNFLGEVIIDLAQISRQAKKLKKDEEHELIFILVHGLLHLMGYEDKKEDDRLKMNRMAEEFINSKVIK